MKKLGAILVILAVALPAMARENASEDAGLKETVQSPIVLRPGDYFSGEITSDALKSWDIFPIVCIGSGTLNFQIEDGYIMGDTMLGLLFKAKPTAGLAEWGYATSPDTISLSAPVSVYGVLLGIAGYLKCPGGFPAGYYVDASF